MKLRTGLFVVLFSITSLAYGADVPAGKALYERACKSCHGADGTPNPAIVKAMKVEMHALGAKEVQSQSDAALKSAITDGKGKMKPVKSVTGPAAADVVAYVRSFQK